MGDNTAAWIDAEKWQRAQELHLSAVTDKFLAELSLDKQRAEAAYDAGFEAGVLATENGLGRADA